jgi:hypothetical protein
VLLAPLAASSRPARRTPRGIRFFAWTALQPFRAEQADASSFTFASCERVGLRRENSAPSLTLCER